MSFMSVTFSSGERKKGIAGSSVRHLSYSKGSDLLLVGVPMNLLNTQLFLWANKSGGMVLAHR